MQPSAPLRPSPLASTRLAPASLLARSGEKKSSRLNHRELLRQLLTVFESRGHPIVPFPCFSPLSLVPLSFRPSNPPRRWVRPNLGNISLYLSKGRGGGATVRNRGGHLERSRVRRNPPTGCVSLSVDEREGGRRGEEAGELGEC